MSKAEYKGRELDFYSLLQWGRIHCAHVAGYHSNGHEDPYGKYQWICGFAKEGAEVFTGSPTDASCDEISQNRWVFGGVSYEVKNHIEKLESPSRDYIQWPTSHWFVADCVIGLRRNGEWEVLGNVPEDLQPFTPQNQTPFELNPLWSREEYIAKADRMLAAIQRGDIYEVNLCMAFESDVKSEAESFDTLSAFYHLNEKAKSSFAAYFSSGEVEVMSASPERYLRKEGSRLISQPIKGTSPRYEDLEKDAESAAHLLESEKERSENVMIVDMVRNDLSHTAQKNSVVVEELFGIYSFNTVHQMISTISSQVRSDVPFSEIIRTTFPMGSMTGAPKVSAMNHIDQVETTQRGWYSGSLGYVDPDGNFDLNVVIRTLLYNLKTQRVQTHVGSALTILADPEMEYQECLLKVQALKEITSQEPKAKTPIHDK
jgi:para-aminobenzoate synthetase component 1